ncbi:MAG: tRNA (adenosine(37)-N6)-threonylcarbamoyltransferase complex ATPase subunit type 1 TsaE [Proteobacteria bacterium ST_bin12]|nr:MAG: tRNA (adenosine(37)-N6)-threonylcarbamoyltransferase complex ATPase subunit type 1 TsaE [Proteobacteria bacterium ST_bin12]
MVNDIILAQNNAALGNNLAVNSNLSQPILLTDETATLAAGVKLSQSVVANLVIFLRGDLGAGKTTFTRGFLQGLGFKGKVKSPTYTLVEPYSFNNLIVYHFDLYRFIDEEEWEAAGFREYFNASSICLIEWPEKAGYLLPEPDIHVHLIHDALQRKIQFSANTPRGEQCLAKQNM